jgi:hypothetical protein
MSKIDFGSNAILPPTREDLPVCTEPVVLSPVEYFDLKEQAEVRGIPGPCSTRADAEKAIQRAMDDILLNLSEGQPYVRRSIIDIWMDRLPKKLNS